MTNLSRAELHCNDTQILIPYCVQCIRTIPCYCAITILSENTSSPHTVWPPRLTRCPRSINVTNVTHIVNLAALQSFFSRPSLGALTGNIYLPQPLSVSLPDFRHFRHKFQDFLSAERTRSHDLRKFAASVKNDTLIYDDLADIVLHDSNNWQSNGVDLFIPRFTTPTWWLLWSSLLSSYLTLDMTIYLCCLLYTSPSPRDS